MASGYDKPPFKAPHIEDGNKRVRVLFNGKMVVDTYKPKLVYAILEPLTTEHEGSPVPFVSWEHPYYPIYYFYHSDFTSAASLHGSDAAQPEEGTKVYDLHVGDRVAKAAVTEFTGEGKHKDLASLFKLEFSSADAWFEEDERIYVHPKDPYKVCPVFRCIVLATEMDDSVQSASTCCKRRGTSVSR